MIENDKVLSKITGYQMVATIEALERAGLNLEGFSLLRSNLAFAEQVVRCANNAILGSIEIDNRLLSMLDDGAFFGPTDWIRYFNIKMKTINWPDSFHPLETILNSSCPFVPGKKIKETHYLFCLPNDYKGLPLTINRWEEIYKHKKNLTLRSTDVSGIARNYADSCYQSLDFSKKEQARLNWYLMFKGVIPGSTKKTFSEQKEMLKDFGYEIPCAIEVLSMFLLAHEKNKKLFTSVYQIHGRTADEYSTNNNIAINTEYLEGQRIYIYNGTGNFRAKNNNEIKDSRFGVFGYKKL